jgi:hypothetical protein
MRAVSTWCNGGAGISKLDLAHPLVPFQEFPNRVQGKCCCNYMRPTSYESRWSDVIAPTPASQRGQRGTQLQAQRLLLHNRGFGKLSLLAGSAGPQGSQNSRMYSESGCAWPAGVDETTSSLKANAATALRSLRNVVGLSGHPGGSTMSGDMGEALSCFCWRHV